MLSSLKARDGKKYTRTSHFLDNAATIFSRVARSARSVVACRWSRQSMRVFFSTLFAACAGSIASNECLAHYPWGCYTSWHQNVFANHSMHFRLHRPWNCIPRHFVSVRYYPIYRYPSYYFVYPTTTYPVSIVRPVSIDPWCMPPQPIYFAPVPVVPFCGVNTSFGSGHSVHQQLVDLRLQRVPNASLTQGDFSGSGRWYRPREFEPAAMPVVKLQVASPHGESPKDATSGAIRFVSTQDDKPRSEVRFKPAVMPLEPSSAAWAASANGVIDRFMKEGDLASAAKSCESMLKNHQPLASGTYLRCGVIKLFSPDSDVLMEDVLEPWNRAVAGGSRLMASELNVPRLRDYLKGSNIDLDSSLDAISQKALSSDSESVEELLLLATLLKLDGQDSRSSIFASEAFDRASNLGTIRWSSLLSELHR